MNKKSSLKDVAYQILKSKILNNEFAPNAYLDEKSLCAMLNISRTPMREAISKLEYENFKTTYKDNKKILKKVEENVDWIYQMFEYPTAIRKTIYTTNAIESLNSGLRKVTKGKGSFINENALMKVLYLRIKDLQKKWSKGIRNWKNIQNELTEIFEDRYFKYIENK